MAIYKQLFPTNWPILEFNLSLWKFHIGTEVMSPVIDSLVYHYIAFFFDFGEKRIFNFRLYELSRRVKSRLDGIYEDGEVATLAKLEKWKALINDEIDKINKRG